MLLRVHHLADNGHRDNCMKKRIPLAALIMFSGSALLTGCSSTDTTQSAKLNSNYGSFDRLIVPPVLPNPRQELTLAKINAVLAEKKLPPQQKARLHYDRGVMYDSVGLKIMARIDFIQALNLDPSLADAYNFLGIYYTQSGQYNNAYEAFDSVLELSPEYDYAYLNRGIAQYYGGRNDLATTDIQTFYQADKSDGYRALWLYLVESVDDINQARGTLLSNRSQLQDNTWPAALVDFYLGKLSSSQLLSAAAKDIDHPSKYSDRLCEAYFYMAKIAQQQGNEQQALNYFKLTLATNIYDFVEHRYARLELSRLATRI